jgi:hypothetical protein
MDSNDERASAAAEVSARLRSRGITVHARDNAQALEDLLEAVERFEAAVESHGGDLMVDDLKSVKPDDPHFVLPRRTPQDSVRDYVARIEAATGHLRSHPKHPD